mgnify:CR=1 FL=1
MYARTREICMLRAAGLSIACNQKRVNRPPAVSHILKRYHGRYFIFPVTVLRASVLQRFVITKRAGCGRAGQDGAKADTDWRWQQMPCHHAQPDFRNQKE